MTCLKDTIIKIRDPLLFSFLLLLVMTTQSDKHLPQVAAAPPGAQVATLDVEDAYCIILVKPDHKHYLIVLYNNRFYMDHDVPFGLTSTTGLQSEVADATIDIWEYHNISPAVKWVDNFNVFCFPKTDGLFHGTSNDVEYPYGYDLTSIKTVIAPLGIPWHKSKGQEFLDMFIYLGFQWVSPTRLSPSPTSSVKNTCASFPRSSQCVKGSRCILRMSIDCNVHVCSLDQLWFGVPSLKTHLF